MQEEVMQFLYFNLSVLSSMAMFFAKAFSSFHLKSGYFIAL